MQALSNRSARVQGAVSRPSRQALHVCAAQSIKLTYFSIAGRAEATRLLFRLGNIPFEDERITKEQWLEIKPTTPFGQVPTLQIDGTTIAQSGAIERLAAKMAGLYPTDPLEAAKVDEGVFFINEFLMAFASTFTIQDPAEKAAARKVIVEGPLKEKLNRLNSMLEKSKSGYLVGDKLTYADVAAFVCLGSLTSGFFDGVPTDLYNSYPAVAAYKSRIAAVPGIKAFYDEQKDDPTRSVFRS